MRFIAIILFFFISFIHIFSQDNNSAPLFKKKSTVKEYKVYYKAGNYSKAYDILQSAFAKFPVANNDPDLWFMAMNAKYQLYLEENKKIFLKNNADTTKFFTYIYDSYTCGLKSDSLVELYIIKDKQKHAISTEIHEKLYSLRSNLLSGGKYFLKHKKYYDAFKYFDIYLSTRQIGRDDKTKFRYSVVDSDSVYVSKLAVHSAYGCQKYSDVMKYLNIAVSDTTRRDVLLEIGAKSAIQIKDSLKYLELLIDGFENYPQNDYFKANLIQFYHNNGNYYNSIDIIDRCIVSDSLNVKYWKLKGGELRSIGDVESALIVYLHVMDLDPYDYETASIIGNLYLDKAHSFFELSNLDMNSPSYRENRNVLINLYILAQKYFEVALQLQPLKPELWKDGLFEIYLKLNKGDELRKIESM